MTAATQADRAAIRALVAAELTGPADDLVPPALLQRLTGRPGARALLLYGARRRPAEAGVPAGPVDLYLLTDRTGGPGALHRLLPPAIAFEAETPGTAPTVKLATMRVAAFRARMRRMSWDTTLWARFSQPVQLVWAADPEARAEVAEALTEAILTAGWWAARLVPDRPSPEARWAGLYAHTYAAELRVERADARALSLIAGEEARFARLAALAIAPAGDLSGPERAAARRAWRRRVGVGKALNLARLAKAALTAPGALEYAVSKVERHSGAPVALSPWQRRWPLLGAPVALWRLWRARRLR